jgi:GAF domain-containing protein
MSPTPDSKLANPEQRIADLRRANAELQRRLDERTAERDEALAQQTATGEVLGIINSSPGDLTPVFDVIIEQAVHLCGAVFGALFLSEDGHLRAVAIRGGTEAWRDRMRTVGFGVSETPVSARLLTGERFVHIVDLAQIDHPLVQAAVASVGARTFLSVPLRSKDNELRGMIVASRAEVRPYSDKEIALLQNFAAQAVIAMENARLITETREALEQQTATAEVLQVINSSPGDLTPVFDAILEKAHTLCEAAIGALLTFDGESFDFLARKVPAELAGITDRPFKPGPRDRLNDLIRGEPLLHIDAREVLALAPEDPQLRAIVEVGGMRTYLAVPLRKDDRLIGAITAARQEVRPFTDKQIALLQNFAAQAVIAMENARLITETREALEQQTATAEVLQVINASPGDLAPVFDAMLEKAMRLCEADFGLMLTIDGAASRIVAERDVPQPLIDFLAQHLPEIGPDTFFGRAVLGRAVLHTADMRAEAAYSSGQPLTLTAVDLAGVRALLMAPLHKDDGVSGVFAIFRRDARPFTDKQIALLQNFAAQAVIAMENARLLGELRQRTGDLEEALEQQTATAEVLGVINFSPGDLAPVFDAMLEKATGLCEAAFGVLRTWNGNHFHFAAAYGHQRLTEWARTRPPIAPGDGSPLGRIVGGEAVVRIVDAPSEYETAPGFREMVEISGMRSAITVALRKEDTLVGSLTVYRQEVRPFTDKQIALLQNFATQAVIAMENARLITETREALERQTATAEVLGVINSSPGDLAPVFDAILEKAHTLCGAALGSLVTYDGEYFHVVAAHGQPQEYRALLREPFRATPGSPFERLLLGERLVHVPDATVMPPPTDDRLYPAAVSIVGVRTALFVPLRKDCTLLGYISAQRREVRPFSDKEIALLANFAAQAVIAMENARLITETREALEQQTATAEVLGVINSSPGNLMPVFDAILEKAHSLCGAEYGTLQLYDGEMFRAIATRGTPESVATLLREPHPPGPNSSRLLAGDRFCQSVDQAESVARGLSTGPINVAAAKSGTRTLLLVPLRKDTSLIGCISAARMEVKPFSDKQIALLENFAAQAVIAMENARLITETREALEQQTAIAKVLRVINSSPGDPQPLFDELVETAARLCETNEAGLAIRSGDGYRYVATRSLDPAWEARVSDFSFTPSRETATGRTLLERRIIHIDDLAADTEHSVPEIVTVGGLRTFLGVPLLREGEPLGVLALARQHVERFTERQIGLISAFADQAVIAMENARLITETREALEQQTATAEVLGVINSSPGDLAPVFDAILEKAHSLCGAEYGGLVIHEGEEFRMVAAHGEAHFVEAWRQLGPVRPPEGSPPTRLIRGERIIHILDVRTDDALRNVPPEMQRLYEVGGVRTMLIVPLRKDGTVLGLITAYRQEVRPFSDKQIALLENFAAQAVIAMENARLLDELHQRTDQVAELNRGLEARVAEQVEELGRVGRLKRFLAPQLAELIVSHGDEKILESHRRDIVVVFCDLRGYTAFTETAEPEEVLDFLREYHGALGPLVSQFEGTLDQFSGDGIMVFFNDPVPCLDPAERAVKMAMAMREAAAKLIAAWRRHGSELGFGAGIAQGYATLGQIGFSDRSGYTAIGTVCNLAARLCAEAKDGQILVSSRIAEAVEAVARLEDLGNLELKGLRRPVAAFNVMQSTSAADARPNLTVVARGPEA